MKRMIALCLLSLILLSACGADAATSVTQPTATTEKALSLPPADVPTETQNTQPETEPTEITEITEPAETTEPIMEAEPADDPGEPVTDPAPTVPQPSVTPPVQQPETPPAQSTPQPPAEPEPTAPQQKPSAPTVSGRPTSSATCKDTGSDQIWEVPQQDDTADPWQTNGADPSRSAYLEYLKQNGNPYFYYIDTDGIKMRLGRTYAVPLITSYEMMLATVWTCSDPAIASVNEVGFLVPLRYGKAVVTASYTDPETRETTVRECEILVVPEPEPFTFAQLEQRAHEEAKLIADYALHYEGASTDLERISVAAGLVYQYVKAGRGGSEYRIVDGELVSYMIPGYDQPFGTLVTFHSTCAGDVRALGLVLEYMGFSWYHVNANQWDHQWCVVYDVDGQTAFADSSTFGIVGYGPRQDDKSNWQIFRNGSLQAF